MTNSPMGYPGGTPIEGAAMKAEVTIEKDGSITGDVAEVDEETGAAKLDLKTDEERKDIEDDAKESDDS